MAPQGDFGLGATFMPRDFTVEFKPDGTVAEVTVSGDLTTGSGQHGFTVVRQIEPTAEERAALQALADRLAGEVRSHEGVGQYVPPAPVA